MAGTVPRPLRKPFRLTGEPEDSHSLEDGLHWRSVYEELRAGFRWISDGESQTHKRARQRQMERLEQRFAFWDRRYRELLTQLQEAKPTEIDFLPEGQRPA